VRRAIIELGAFAAIFCLIWGVKEIFTTKIDKKKYVNAACKIDTKYSTGSGHLLKNGNVITSLHVVDDNENSLLDIEETYGDVRIIHGGNVYPAVVIWPSIGDVTSLDVAVLRFAGSDGIIKNVPDIGLVSEMPSVGDKLFCVSFMANCDRPHYIGGNQSFPDDDIDARSDISVQPGASGAAIIDEKSGNIAGVARGGWLMPKGGLVPQWCFYVPADKMRDQMPSWIFSKRPEDYMTSPLYYLSMLMIIVGFSGAILVVYLWLRSR
jgi:hypothetical protein